MCGIFAQAGMIDAKKAISAAALFAYRGPDGTHVDDADGVTLIQHRLAIIDTRAVADQPLWNDDHTIGVVFNGEIYNFRELRKAHFPETQIWKTEGDTEVIVKLYEKYGLSFTRFLDGMYAIVLLDKKKGQLLAFRDRFGIKPLYYSVSGSGFVCASEVKGVVAALRAAGERVSPQTGIMHLYTTLGYIPSPRTVVSEVSALMPGTHLSYNLKTKQVVFGVSPAYEESGDIGPTDLIEVATRSILRNTIADVPVGVFLSGGIDSTFIAHVLGSNGLKFKALTMVIPGRLDAGYAKLVAEHYGLEHESIQFTPELFESTYKIVRNRLDTPTVAASLIPTLALSRAAHEQVAVMLSGEGGDEVFMGYPRHIRLARLRSGHPQLAFIANLRLPRRIVEDIFYGIGNAEAFYAMASGVIPDQQGIQQFSSMVRERGDIPVDFDLNYYLENVLLPKIDLGTMYASIEGRVPFCSSPLLSATRAAGVSSLQANGITKAPLKSYLSRYLPHEIVYRKKSGFSIPFAHFAAASPQVQEDTLDLQEFMHERFPEHAVRLLPAIRRNHYVWYALLALMYCYQNLDI